MKKYVMNHGERRQVSFHETGHAAMVYWRRESLHSRMVCIHPDRYGGANFVRLYDADESDLFVLLGGPMAEFLSMGIVPQKPLLFPSEYGIPTSDSTRLRNLARRLVGPRYRGYLFRKQESCRELMQRPDMWSAITAVATRLASEGELNGEHVEEMFMAFGAPRLRF